MLTAILVDFLAKFQLIARFELFWTVIGFQVNFRLLAWFRQQVLIQTLGISRVGRGTIWLTKLLFMYHAMFINPDPFLRRYRHLLPLDLKPLPQITKEPFHLRVQRRRIDVTLIRRVLKLAANVMPSLIDQIDRVTFDTFFALNLI